MPKKLFSEEELADLPGPIRKQAEEAAKLQEKISNGENPETPTEPAEQTEPTEPIEPAEPTEPTEPTEPKPPESEKKDNFEHKYNVLQGMIRKKDQELAVLKSDVQKLSENLTRANKIIDDFNIKKHQDEKKSQEKKEIKPKIRLEQFEDYGPEMTEMVNTVNALVEENRSLKDKLQDAGKDATLSKKVDQIEKHQQFTDEERYVSRLSALVPDWEKINNDTSFHAFLSETDPFTGLTRQELLTNADKALDANRVANFFNIFKQKNNIDTSSNHVEKKKDLKSQVVPDTQSGGGGQNGTTVPRITDQQLQQAAIDVGRGRIKPEDYENLLEKYQKQLSGG